jgi:hypothetical protein
MKKQLPPPPSLELEIVPLSFPSAQGVACVEKSDLVYTDH